MEYIAYLRHTMTNLLFAVDLVYLFRSPSIPNHTLPIVGFKLIIYTIIVECCMTFSLKKTVKHVFRSINRHSTTQSQRVRVSGLKAMPIFTTLPAVS